MATAFAMPGRAAASAAGFKDTGVTFAIALVLFVPLIGLRTEETSGPLEITAHLQKALAYAVAVTAFRFAALRYAGGVWAAFARWTSRYGTLLTIAAALAGAVFYWSPATRALVASTADVIGKQPAEVLSLAIFVLMAAFVILAALVILRAARSVRDRTQPATPARARDGDLVAGLPVALLAIALLLPLLASGPEQGYAVDIATQILIYIMLGWGLNIVVGLAGLLDLGYVAFYAAGAYSYALLSSLAGLPFWACLPLAGGVAAVLGVALGFPVLRLRGDYLAIVTLAFGEIIHIVLLNWRSLTGGPNGLLGIPSPTLFGLTFGKGGATAFHRTLGIEYNPVYKALFLYYVILTLALVTNFVTLRLKRAPIGRAWEALREDEIACRALGIDTVSTKLTAFATGAMFAGFAGSFFAAQQGFISPESFTFQESALVLAIVVLGGLGSQLGVVLAAVALLGTQEKLRELHDYRMLLFGIAMVVVMTWRPRGLMATRTPSILLGGR